ncbi:SSI family serine proteinase inhibitor [Streptomyces sp. NBC_01304]|uniref:SSI family serine proteinase inhibitor n=1 Tax=Streptomyces sp. NBC_01304 TaxID=2903818 RepID=UPI002E11C978|nr:subtilase-type protease inhibitor [Streptomyces sp. NBC_01304]
MLRRLAVTVVASAAALSVSPTVAQAMDAPLPLWPMEQPDHLTVTAAETGGLGDGTYELECGTDGSAGGTHPDPAAACERLAQLAGEGADPFAPMGADMYCTMQYGGPGTAHITGSWQGQHVDATYGRSNGCEIGRWNTLVPVLPEAGQGQGGHPVW